MKEQSCRVEQFRDNIKKFKKTNLKTFRFDKFRRHFDKREDAFIIQDFKFLNPLNNLNSD